MATITLSRPTRLLHWLIAIMMIGMLVSGAVMEEFELYSLYPLHKSFGTLFLAFATIRLAWRIKEGWLPPAAPAPRWQQNVASVLHIVLLAATIMMPVSGIIMSAVGGTGLQVFGLELVSYNLDPETSLIKPYNETLAKLGGVIHDTLPKLVIASILLHIAGAFKHHIVDKDATLRRMIGRA